MTTKRSWPPSLPRWAKPFSISYVFYAFALCDSNNTGEISNKWYKRSSVLVPWPTPSTQLICLNVYEFDKPFNYTVILHFKMLQNVFLEIISLDAWIVALITTECVDMCSLKWRLCEKKEVQWEQLKGFSHEWVSMCLLRIFAPFATIRLFSSVDSHVDSKPASLIARVVALWANKRFVSALNSHVGFQIGKFGSKLQSLHQFGFWFMICVFSLCWRLQSIGIAEKNKLIWPGPFPEKWKWHATMMTMMMMMMTGIFTYGTNTYRYSFRRYSVRTPSRFWSWWWWWGLFGNGWSGGFDDGALVNEGTWQKYPVERFYEADKDFADLIIKCKSHICLCWTSMITYPVMICFFKRWKRKSINLETGWKIRRVRRWLQRKLSWRKRKHFSSKCTMR